MCYYKQIEESFARYRNVLKQLDACFGEQYTTKFGFNMEIFPEKIIWSRFEPVRDLHLSENELSNEKKEEIALFNKDMFDEAIHKGEELVEFINSSLSVVKKNEAFTNNVSQICLDIIDTMIQIGDFASDAAMPLLPLNLTNEELYNAFSFFTNEEVRDLLKGQTQKTFNALYSAIHKRDKTLFLSVLNEIEILPINALKGALVSKVEKTIPFQEYILTSDQPQLLQLFASETDIDDSAFDMLNTFRNGITEQTDLPEVDIESMLSIQQDMLSKYHSLVENCKDIPSFYRKKLSKSRDQWQKGTPEKLKVEEPIDDFLSNPLFKIINALMDKWLLFAIHKKMEEEDVVETTNNVERQVGKKRQHNQIIRLGVSRVIMDECRLAGKEKDTSLIYSEAIAILYDFLTGNSREIIKLKRSNVEVLIGPSLDCSLDEFKYLLCCKDVEADFEVQPHLNWINKTAEKPKSEFRALLYALYLNANPKLSDAQQKAEAPSNGERKNICQIEGKSINKLSDNASSVNPLIQSWVDLLKACGKKAKGRYQRGEI